MLFDMCRREDGKACVKSFFEVRLCFIVLLWSKSMTLKILLIEHIVNQYFFMNICYYGDTIAFNCNICMKLPLFFGNILILDKVLFPPVSIKFKLFLKVKGQVQ